MYQHVCTPVALAIETVALAAAGNPKYSKQQGNVLNVFPNVCKKVALAIETVTLAAAGNRKYNKK